MQTTIRGAGALAPPAQPRGPALPVRERILLGLLGLGAVGVIAEAWSGRLARGPAGRPAVPFLVSLLLAGICLLVGTWGRQTWVGTRIAAIGLLAAGVIQAEAWAARGGWWILG